MNNSWLEKSGAQWIWPAAVGDKENQYVQVLHDLELPEDTTPTAQIALSADTNYAVWLNGRLVGFGQWSDYPDDKTFDVLDLTPHARPGKNRLAILAWYQGVSTSQYRKGEPGIVYAVRRAGAEKPVVVSGSESRMRQAPDYVSGPVPRVSPQLSFTFEHRAQHDDGWRADFYEPGSSWTTPAPGEQKPLASRPVRPRPVARLLFGERLPMKVLAQGVFNRTDFAAPPAPAIQTDALAWRDAGQLFQAPHAALTADNAHPLRLKPEILAKSTGAYIVLDMGREETGVLDLEIEATSGTVFDIGYGEHLDDLRVRASVGPRHFASRYTCASGRQTFLHPFLRLAGRYLQIHVIPPDGAKDQPVTIHYAGLRPTDYPAPTDGSFVSSDSLHNRIWEVSERTLQLCMHEHYEDCPWREQALYTMDARNQILAGFYCFGNYDFVAASLDLFGKALNPKDGFLELCAPAEVPITIPSYSLAWILSLDDYLLYSGDRDFVRKQLSIARTLLNTSSRESSGPLVLTPTGSRMWNFYEWAPGLDGAVYLKEGEERYDAPFNLFYVLCLDAMARMARECGEPDAEEFARASHALKAAFPALFWDEKEGALRTYAGPGQQPHFSELTQSLAILAGAVSKEQAAALRDRLARENNGLVACTLSHCFYKFEALLTDRERHGKRVFEIIERDWGYMLSQGATSFWETIEGARAFGNAGSLCHGWSGIPAWFYSAYVLGVKPTAPGFAQYEMNPLPGVVDSAEGTVPTPTGLLKASWRLKDGKVEKQLEEAGGVASN